jgi:hypothetical protein
MLHKVGKAQVQCLGASISTLGNGLIHHLYRSIGVVALEGQIPSVLYHDVSHAFAFLGLEGYSESAEVQLLDFFRVVLSLLEVDKGH